MPVNILWALDELGNPIARITYATGSSRTRPEGRDQLTRRQAKKELRALAVSKGIEDRIGFYTASTEEAAKDFREHRRIQKKSRLERRLDHLRKQVKTLEDRQKESLAKTKLAAPSQPHVVPR